MHKTILRGTVLPAGHLRGAISGSDLALASFPRNPI